MTSELKLDYGEFVAQVEQSLKDAGKFQGVEMSQFEHMLDEQIESYRDVYRQMLQDDWANLFADVEFSSELLEAELDKYMAKIKGDAQQAFVMVLAKERRLLVIKQMVFNRYKLSFGLLSIVSIFTLPMWLVLMLQPTDFSLYLGASGIIANIALLLFFYVNLNK